MDMNPSVEKPPSTAAADHQDSQVKCRAGAHVLYGEAAAEVAVVRGVGVPRLPDRRSLHATQPRTLRPKDIKSQRMASTEICFGCWRLSAF